MDKKTVTAYISRWLLQNLNSTHVERFIELFLDEVGTELTGRKRIDVEIDYEDHIKISNLKETTKYPKWYIIEQCIKKGLEGHGDYTEIGGEEQGEEPSVCPFCGAGNDDLLISHSDQTFYCYRCEKGDEY